MNKKSANAKAESRVKAAKGQAGAPKADAKSRDDTKPDGKFSGRDYDRAMKKLHVELVKLQ